MWYKMGSEYIDEFLATKIYDVELWEHIDYEHELMGGFSEQAYTVLYYVSRHPHEVWAYQQIRHNVSFKFLYFITVLYARKMSYIQISLVGVTLRIWTMEYSKWAVNLLVSVQPNCRLTQSQTRPRGRLRKICLRDKFEVGFAIKIKFRVVRPPRIAKMIA